VAGCFERGDEPSCSIKRGGFLDCRKSYMEKSPS
jgi:hypothetical protein